MPIVTIFLGRFLYVDGLEVEATFLQQLLTQLLYLLLLKFTLRFYNSLELIAMTRVT